MKMRGTAFVLALLAVAAMAWYDETTADETGLVARAGGMRDLDKRFLSEVEQLRQARVRELARDVRNALNAEDFDKAFALSAALEEAAARLGRPRVASLAPAGQVEILEARWGMGSRWVDVTERVREWTGPEGLNVYVTYRTLGDPAPRWKKTLFVAYALDGEVHVAVGAENHRLLITP